MSGERLGGRRVVVPHGGRFGSPGAFGQSLVMEHFDLLLFWKHKERVAMVQKVLDSRPDYVSKNCASCGDAASTSAILAGFLGLNFDRELFGYSGSGLVCEGDFVSGSFFEASRTRVIFVKMVGMVVTERANSERVVFRNVSTVHTWRAVENRTGIVDETIADFGLTVHAPHLSPPRTIATRTRMKTSVQMKPKPRCK